MSSYLRVLSDSFTINTNMTGFRWLSTISVRVHWTKEALALEGSTSSQCERHHGFISHWLTSNHWQHSHFLGRIRNRHRLQRPETGSAQAWLISSWGSLLLLCDYRFPEYSSLGYITTSQIKNLTKFILKTQIHIPKDTVADILRCCLLSLSILTNRNEVMIVYLFVSYFTISCFKS